jgi:hypothetical protein
MKKGNKYTVKTFRYEFLINFFLPLLWTVLIIFFLFLKKNILLLALILIPITILFFETLRVTGLKKNFSKVLLGLSSAILVQVIMNFYFFFFKDSFLKNNYFNVNDSEISNI